LNARLIGFRNGVSRNAYRELISEALGFVQAEMSGSDAMVNPSYPSLRDRRGSAAAGEARQSMQQIAEETVRRAF